jgi:hypothetical protein
MNVSAAASNTLLIWQKNIEANLPKPEREDTGLTLGHQHWLLLEVMNENIEGEKAHRWLSWAQGVLTSRGQVSLTDCKYANAFS